MNWKIGGFNEAGISVRDIDAWARFLRDTGGWQVVHRGMADDGWKTLWSIDAAVPVEECLLCCPGDDTGMVRLFRFGLESQQETRHGTTVRDPGGHYDLDVRVQSMDRMRPAVRSGGWTGVSPEPVTWAFGPLTVCEWLINGPESVVFALVERIDPPLEPPETAAGFSRAFNSSQIVSHMDASIAFYERLGFQKVVHHTGPLGGGGGAVLGLPPGEADVTDVDLVILSPTGIVDGSVELVTVAGESGRDVSAVALPHQLGLNLLRFPVEGIDAFTASLAESGLKSEAPGIVSAQLPPVGAVRVIALRSPDGAWLEFYEVNDKTE